MESYFTVLESRAKRLVLGFDRIQRGQHRTSAHAKGYADLHNVINFTIEGTIHKHAVRYLATVISIFRQVTTRHVNNLILGGTYSYSYWRHIKGSLFVYLYKKCLFTSMACLIGSMTG